MGKVVCSVIAFDGLDLTINEEIDRPLLVSFVLQYMTDVWLVTVHGSRPLVVRCSAALTLSGALDIPWDTLLTVLEAVVETWRFMLERPKIENCERFMKEYGLGIDPPMPELSSNDMVATNEGAHKNTFAFFSPPLSSESLACAPIRLQWSSECSFGHSLHAVREQAVENCFVTVSIPSDAGTGTLAVTRTSLVLTIDGGEEILREHNWKDLHPGELRHLGVYMFAQGFRVAIGGEGR